MMRVKSEVKYIKGFAVPSTFEKRIVKYENDTTRKNAMNFVISAVQHSCINC